ncbi:hypothetical protein MUN88_19020 [Gracilibacillus caseinilyticus]|uniref:Uncharacterized protein n=1 Tax=Gracilibacillus caseinilyticus TaxID=2932256 RepID=A0ABY4EUM3_9BACI|nr:hypothetical protein [Gracilibacillus caseinilyticus]UOQ48115.1 hypothetical protein MUN88_19020 [Gracilibacillus caseinilyticus]
MRYLSNEEFQLGSRYLFLSLAIQVIQKNLEKLRNQSIFKLNEPYVMLLESIEKKAIEERRQSKIRISQEKIDVLETNQTDTFTEYTYFCKGKAEKKKLF